MSQSGSPSRGEVWLADLDPVIGHEQAGRRPVLVISTDAYNHGPAALVVVLPITSRRRGLPLHVELAEHEAGLSRASTVLCDAIRSVSRQRLQRCWGRVDTVTLAAVEERVRQLLELATPPATPPSAAGASPHPTG